MKTTVETLKTQVHNINNILLSIIFIVITLLVLIKTEFTIIDIAIAALSIFGTLIWIWQSELETLEVQCFRNNNIEIKHSDISKISNRNKLIISSITASVFTLSALQTGQAEFLPVMVFLANIYWIFKGNLLSYPNFPSSKNKCRCKGNSKNH